MSTLTTAAQDAIARWKDPERRPPFKGQLFDMDAYRKNGGGDGDGGGGDPTGCACAQGDVLLHNGFGPQDLLAMAQVEADEKVAELLGISVTHSILLRQVNDSADGCPQDVLTNPEKIIGAQAPTILAFWRHLDRMTGQQWGAAGAAGAEGAARAAWAAGAEGAAGAAGAAGAEGAEVAALAALAAGAAGAAGAAWAEGAARAAGDIVYCVLAEISGTKWRPEHDKGEYVFLPMFGFADPQAVLDADAAASSSK